MGQMALSDLQRALIYGESELGGVATLKESNNTYAITNAASGATVLAAGQSCGDERASL
jgi:hypothetical protein